MNIMKLFQAALRVMSFILLVVIYSCGMLFGQSPVGSLKETPISGARIFANQQHAVMFAIIHDSLLVTIYSCADSEALVKKHEFTIARGMPVGAFILDSGSRLILIEDENLKSEYEIQIFAIDYELKQAKELFSVKSSDFGKGSFRKASDRLWYGGLCLVNSYLGQIEINPPLQKASAHPIFHDFPRIILDYRNGKIIEKE